MFYTLLRAIALIICRLYQISLRGEDVEFPDVILNQVLNVRDNVLRKVWPFFGAKQDIERQS